MAYDIFSKATTTGSWSRDEVSTSSNDMRGDWAKEKTLEMFKKRWGGTMIAGATGLAALLFLPRILRSVERKREAKHYRELSTMWSDEDTTVDIRRPSMKELIRRTRKAA